MKSRSEIVAMVAGQAHKDWCVEWKSKNGDAPRIKKTNDSAFNVRGITEVDIAALEYDQLPEDWKAENKANAEVAYDSAVVNCGEDFSLEFAAARVHDAWLCRNPWAKDQYPQSKPYSELPEEEKEKDRLVLRRVLAAMED